MADLKGTIVSQVKTKNGYVFFDILTNRPYLIPTMSPTTIQNVVLIDGEWGIVGTVTSWTYILDGKVNVAKEIIQEIDEEKRSVTFKVIGGDSMELYKSLYISAAVDIKGENNLVTWTFNYEKLAEDVPEPSTLMDLYINVTKDMEANFDKGDL